MASSRSLHTVHLAAFGAGNVVGLGVMSMAGIGVGILGRVAHVPSLQTVAPDLARRLAWVALLGFGIFLLLSLGLVWHSGLMLLEGA